MVSFHTMKSVYRLMGYTEEEAKQKAKEYMKLQHKYYRGQP